MAASVEGENFPKMIFKASFGNKIRITVLRHESLYYLLPFSCARRVSHSLSLYWCASETARALSVSVNRFIELKLYLWINLFSCRFLLAFRFRVPVVQVRKLLFFVVAIVGRSIEICTCTRCSCNWFNNEFSMSSSTIDQWHHRT